MADPTWQDVQNIAPGDALAFSDPSTPGGKIPVASQTAILGYVISMLDPNNWGSLLFMGTCYYAAHLAKLGILRGAGAVTSESVGPLSRDYFVPKVGESLAYASFTLTSYGLEFLELMRSTGAMLGDVP